MSDWSEASRGFGGTIADFPLTSVLQILELGKKSGFLYVRSFPKVAFLVFRSGGIIQAVSSLRRAGLGELLLADGRIQQKDLTLALDMQRRTPGRKMLGEIFQALELVTHQQILDVLTNQMKEIVRWVLEWKAGEFTFYAGPEAKPVNNEDEEMFLPVGIVVQEVLQSMMEAKDRRRFPRVPVSLKVIQHGAKGPLTVYTRDVSAGGLQILSDELPQFGDVLALEVWIPTLLEPAKAKGKVVRVDPKAGDRASAFAVEFTEIEEEARMILEKLGGALSKLL